jgi:hypothetical protein
MNPINVALTNGSKDSFGNTVSRIFAAEPDKGYAIWEAKEDGRVYCDADNNLLAENPAVSEWTIKLVSLIGEHQQFNGQYNSYLAHAYKLCFDGNSSAAVETLKTTYAEVKRRLATERRAKLAYLLGALVIFATTVSIWSYLCLHGWPDDSHNYASGLTASALGGLLSVAIGKSRTGAETEESFPMNCIYGALRLLIAVIAGYGATLMIRTGIALSFLQAQDAYGGFLLACFLSGYSEMFITGMLTGIENRA